jgi:hypothetical protein
MERVYFLLQVRPERLQEYRSAIGMSGRRCEKHFRRPDGTINRCFYETTDGWSDTWKRRVFRKPWQAWRR